MFRPAPPRYVYRFALLAAVLFAAAPAAAMQAVVIASGVPVIKPGQLLDDRSLLELPAGASVSFIAPDGSRHDLAGPYRGRPLPLAPGGDDTMPTPAGSALLTSLARLVGQTPPGAARLRAPQPPPVAAEPGAIDIASPGIHCIAAATPPVLWRADASVALKMELQRARTGETAALDWPAGSTTLPWPAALGIGNEENYLLRRAGNAIPTPLLLRRLPADLPTPAHRAAWLADHGCAAQARHLLGLPPA